MSPHQKTDLERIYGTPFIDRKASGYYPIEVKKEASFTTSNFILDTALLHLKERLSIDFVIKELTFAVVALVTYVFMQNSGRITALGGFGSIIGFALVSAMAYNFYKASFKSLTPGVICLVGGLILLSSSIHHQYFKFLSTEMINYIIGTGALFIALSLFKAEND